MTILRIALVVLVVGLFVTTPHWWTTPVASQEVDEPFDDDREADEEAWDPLAERRELVEITRDLGEEIEELRDEDPARAERLTARRRELRELIEQFDEAIDVRERLEKAEADGRLDEAAGFEERLESLVEEIEHRRWVGDIRDVVAELRDFAKDDEFPKAARDRARKLGDRGRQLLEKIVALRKAIEEDDEERSEELEIEIEEAEEALFPRFEELELEQLLREARAEGDDEAVRELEQELRAIRAEIGGERPNEDEPSRPGVPVFEPGRNELPKVDVATLDDERDVRAVLGRFCFGCHGADAQEADLNIAAQLEVQPLVRHRESWLRVLQHVKTGVMPPSGEQAPTPVQRARLVAWLDDRINGFDYSTIRNPGYEPARRLSNREYDNTVRDLFGVDPRPASRFPADSRTGGGFDNSSGTLFLQPLVVERYFAAAEEVVDAALPETGAVPSPALRAVVRQLEEGDPVRDDRVIVEPFLRRFLVRALRRPVTDDDVARMQAVYSGRRTAGDSPRASLRRLLGVVLVSPSFLMRVEAIPEGSAGEDIPVGDWDLASRLSYFLWASMPDDRLFQLAGDGTLSEPAVLRAEVDRMLDDPRSDTLGSIFAAQWLGWEHVGTRIRLDPIDNPWCTDSLMAAMREESSRFFVSLLRDDAPLARLIDADYTFVNEELARHYRIAGVKGPELRRVAVDTTRRGGILGHASVLAATSFPDRTSPVNRGRWILADLLGTPPPPPPPNASQFDEAIEERDSLTLRGKLELHRRNPVCAGCHDQIDPLGLSLENFGRFGRWRTRAEGGRVDPSGRLPNGTRFSGLPGLRRVVVEQRMDDLTLQLSRKLLAYALGRQLAYYDEAAVRSIARKLAENGHRTRTLVHAIATSYPFRHQRPPAAKEQAR